MLLFGWPICLVALSGCTTYLARQMVEAPNRLQTPAEKNPEIAAFLNRIRDDDFSRTAMVPVGPPPAQLSIAVLPPGNADMQYEFKLADHTASMHFTAQPLQRYRALPKGTIILLPAFQNGKFMMLPWAFVFAKAGYQCVLVDLRGEGLSTGDWVTWGNVESADITQLIQWLNARNIVAGPLVLMGVSYGASVALRAAALAPQVKAVVAVEPFVNAVDVIRHGGRIMFPTLGFFVSDVRLDEAIQKASQLANTNLEAASVLPAAAALDIPVLYIHAEKDRFVPTEEEQILVSATRDADYIVIPDANHLALPIEFPKYQQRVLNWLATKALNNESAPRPK